MGPKSTLDRDQRLSAPLLLAHTWRAAVAPGATDTDTRRAPGLPVTRMPFARPGREQEEQPRVVRGTHLAALIRIERRQEPGPAGGRIAARVLDLDRAADH